MSSAKDLESGQGHTGVGGSDSAPPLVEAQPVVSQTETKIDHSQRNDNDQPTQTGQGPGQAEAEADIHAASAQVLEDPIEDQDPRMVGDFDGSSKPLWKLFRDEAKSHDEAQISTLKDDMGNALTFAGLFSAALTAFVIDSKQDLQPSPADETVYYLQQHSAILSQISVQLSSIAPEIPIPSTPPPPFPAFNPSASGLRVNIFWFMALVFSLLAAFIAILVQQWARNYMNVFRRYRDPLISSRLRQYLYEKREGWHMPMVAEAVPGLLNISFFLFFAGLGDSLFSVNTKVALSTIIPIGTCILLYIFTVVAPIINPQSPYQNTLSIIFWYMSQKLRCRPFRFRSFKGEIKPASANLAQGQMQLAMEANEARKHRDEQAIRWLIDNMTEDAEMGRFLSAIPDSFNTEWGTEVWKGLRKPETVFRSLADTIPLLPLPIRIMLRVAVRFNPSLQDPTPHYTLGITEGEDPVYELCTRVARSLEICKNRGLFSSPDLWRKHTRACIEVTASFACCAGAPLSLFGNIKKPLGDIGSFEKIRELSMARTDELFVTRWTCLSLMAIQQVLEDSRVVQLWAGDMFDRFAALDDTGNKDAFAVAQKIDKAVQKANDCLFRLYDALPDNDLTDGVIEVLRGHESQFSELEQNYNETEPFEWVRSPIWDMQDIIDLHSCHIISQFPGLLDEIDCKDVPNSFGRLVELSRDPRKLQLISSAQALKSISSASLTLRHILQERDADAYKELLKNLRNYPFSNWRADEMQLWRLCDLALGGLGFTVELFFLALSQLLSTASGASSSSQLGSHSALYANTLPAITSNWRFFKSFHATQNLLLDIAMSRRDEFEAGYPTGVVKQFLFLLGNVFQGETAGPHIDRARRQFESFESYNHRGFRERVLKVLARCQAQSPTS